MVQFKTGYVLQEMRNYSYYSVYLGREKYFEYQNKKDAKRKACEVSERFKNYYLHLNEIMHSSSSMLHEVVPFMDGYSFNQTKQVMRGYFELITDILGQHVKQASYWYLKLNVLSNIIEDLLENLISFCKRKQHKIIRLRCEVELNKLKRENSDFRNWTLEGLKENEIQKKKYTLRVA